MWEDQLAERKRQLIEFALAAMSTIRRKISQRHEVSKNVGLIRTKG
jgi:hypothetical protein